MILKKISIVLPLLILSINSWSQSGAFLSTTTNSRSVAMGNTYIANSNNGGLYSNPASVVLQNQKLDIQLSYRPGLSQTTDNYNLTSMSASITLGDKHTLLLGTKKLDIPSYTLTDTNGNAIGSYTPKESSSGIGYAYSINFRTAVSVSAHYIIADLSDTYSAAAFYTDLGFKSAFHHFDYGVMIRNLGSQLKFKTNESALPLTVATGVGYTKEFSEKHQLITNIELSYIESNAPSKGIAAACGFEYEYNKLLALRTGYYAIDSTLGNNQLSLGGGIKLWGAALDIACYLSGQSFKNNYSISLSWKLE